MSDDQDENAYYMRLVSMYIDIGTETILGVFVHYSPGKDADTFLKGKLHDIIELKTKRILNEEECNALLQKGKGGTHVLKNPLDFNCFDVSLLITLARNLFTVQQLPPPAKGWKHQPKNTDKSIAADLLRLKKIRNVIVGHRPRARLPKWRFDDEWQNVSDIIIRLQQEINPENTEHIKERIERYRVQRLDPSVEKKYDEKLEEWHKEVTKIQDEVEELLKKLDGFNAYFKNKNDRFGRYTKLLFKGGRFVLSAFLSKKIEIEGRDLRSIIDENKDTLKTNITDSKHLDVLFPPTNNTDPLDMSSWDVSLLATVILLLFVSSKDRGIKRHVKRIGDARKTYSDAVLVALDSNAFEDYLTDLKASIEIVSDALDEDKADQCYEILEECKKRISDDEFQTYTDELKEQGSEMKTFTDVFKDTLQKTKDFLQDMITHGINFKNGHDLELKMITLGEDEKKKEMAEKILTEVWHEALVRSMQTSDFQEVKKEVLKILEEIKKSKSITNITIKTSCILLQITCTSPNDMLNIITYFESKRCQESFENISKELGYYVDTVLAVYHIVPIDCLWAVSNEQSDSKQPEGRAIRIPITVSSPAGMKHLISLCDSEEIANSANSIADALSKHLEYKIELKTSTDIKELSNVLDAEMSSSDSGSDGANFESSGNISNQQNQSDVSEEYNEGIIHEVTTGQLLDDEKEHMKGVHTDDDIDIEIDPDTCLRDIYTESNDWDKSDLTSTLARQGDSTQPQERAIRIPITVSSPAGIKPLISLCDSEEITNGTNSIADALSKHLDDTKELHTSTDIKELGNDFDAEMSSSDTGSNGSVLESSGNTSNQLNQPCVSDEYPEGIVHEVSTGQLLDDKKEHMEEVHKDDDIKIETDPGICQLDIYTESNDWDKPDLSSKLARQDALSKHLDDTTELHTSTDIKELGNDFDAEMSSSDSGSAGSVLKSSGNTSNTLNPSDVSDEYPEGLVHEVSTGLLLDDKKEQMKEVQKDGDIEIETDPGTCLPDIHTESNNWDKSDMSCTMPRQDDTCAIENIVYRDIFDIVHSETKMEESNHYDVQGKYEIQNSTTRNVIRRVIAVLDYDIEYDGYTGGITGCCVLPTGHILLTDYYSDVLIKMDRYNGYVDSCDLSDTPKDVCYIDSNVAVVALSRTLQFVDVSEKLTLTKSVKTDNECLGVACHGNKLYVIDTQCVFEYTTDGEYQNVRYTQTYDEDDYHSDFQSIAVSNDGDMIYIIDSDDRLVTIDSSGNHLYTLTGLSNTLEDASNVCVDDQGYVYVLYSNPSTIIQISADGRENLGTVLILDGDYWSMHFDRKNSALLITGGLKEIRVLKLR